MRVAAAEDDLQAHGHLNFTWSDTKLPPIVTLRADSGTAHDILDNIEHHQTHPGPDEQHEDPFSDQQPDEGLDVDREMDLYSWPIQGHDNFHSTVPSLQVVWSYILKLR